MSLYELDALDVALDKVAALNPNDFDAETMRAVVVGLERARHRLAAVSAKVLSKFDTNGDWAGDGCYSGANWLTVHTGTARADAVGRVRLAHRLRAMPVAAEAFESAEITESHVRLLARCLR